MSSDQRRQLPRFWAVPGVGDDGAAAGVGAALAGLIEAGGELPSIHGEGRWSSWKDVGRIADQIAAGLDTCGHPPGTGVALVARNRRSGVATMLGLMRHRYRPVLVSAIQPPAGIASMVASTGAGVVVVDDEDWTPEVSAVVDEHGLTAMRVGGAAGPLVAEVAAAGTPGPGRNGYGSDTVIVVPTSGTTGTPKLIELQASQVPISAEQASAHPPAGLERPPVILPLSLATITGVHGLLRAVGRGRSVALLERVDVEAWAELIHQFRPRRAGLPPAAMRTMLDRGVRPALLASLEEWVTGSAALDPDLQDEFETVYGVPVLVSYGATEFGGAVAQWTRADHAQWRTAKRGSVGRAIDGVGLRVVDATTGDALPHGDQGLLEVLPRGRGTSDWLRTNDLGRLDDDGFLFVDGRADDVIVRGGFKVPLFEIEQALRSHPAVRDVAAVGLADDRLGTVPAAVVTARDGVPIDLDEVLVWLRTRLAPYKIPVDLREVHQLPTLTSQKVDRIAVKELFR